MMRYTKSENLLPIVKKILLKKDKFLNLADKNQTPFYVYDQESIDENIGSFVVSFQRHIPNFQPYFAVKLNHHSLIVSRAVENGYIWGALMNIIRQVDDPLNLGDINLDIKF